MKRRLVHWLIDKPWLCSDRWHGRVPFAAWCLYEWAYQECALNHPEEWQEVEPVISQPLIVERPASISGLNISVSTHATTSSTADVAKILRATFRGPIV